MLTKKRYKLDTSSGYLDDLTMFLGQCSTSFIILNHDCDIIYSNQLAKRELKICSKLNFTANLKKQERARFKYFIKRIKQGEEKIFRENFNLRTTAGYASFDITLKNLHDRSYPLYIVSLVKNSKQNADLSSIYDFKQFKYGLQRFLNKSSISNKILLFNVSIKNIESFTDFYGFDFKYIIYQQVIKKISKIIGKKINIGLYNDQIFFFIFTQNSFLNIKKNIRTITSCLNEVLVYKKHNIKLSFNMGVYLKNNERIGADEVINRVNYALNINKKHTYKPFSLFTQKLAKNYKKEQFIVKNIRQAITNNEIYPVFQPQFCSKTNNLIGVEVLSRWKSPVMGFIPPFEFIKVAEKENFVEQIDEYTYSVAFRQLSQFVKDTGKNLNVSVNISPRMLLMPGLYNLINVIVDSSLIPRNNVTLEITENIFIHDLDKVSQILLNLKECGYKISLDDFGTGYSGISYLTKLPINEIKIDREFINRIPHNFKTKLLLNSIISVAKINNMVTVAEGVETKEQLDWLVANECDCIQGYYFSKPLKYNDFYNKYKIHQVVPTSSSSYIDSSNIINLISKSIMDFYNKNFFKSLLYIDGNTGKMIGRSAFHKGVVSFASSNAFFAEVIEKIKVAFPNKDKETIYTELTLNNIKKHLKNNNYYRYVICEILKDGVKMWSILSFCYVNQDTNAIVYSRIDMTDTVNLIMDKK